MHKFKLPDWAIKRVTARRGKAHAFDTLDASKTALLVVDLQNGFMMEGVSPMPVAYAREIVPNVNRLARAVRDAGGLVVWIQMAFTEESRESWSVLNGDLSTPEACEKRADSLRVGSKGYQIWSDLDVKPEDPNVQKTRFSAFIQGSSDIEALLRSRGIDTVIVTGTVTSVCCDSTARDAMMRNFKVVMVSDGNAARTEEEHGGALLNFYLVFGDVLTTDEVIGALTRTTNAKEPALAT